MGCNCPTLFLHGKQLFNEGQESLQFIEKEILKISESDLEDNEGVAFGEFLLSTLLEAFQNAELSQNLFDLATFNCATVLIKMLGELGINAADKKFIDFATDSLLSKTSGLAETLLDTKVKSRLESELGLVLDDTNNNEHGIMKDYVSSY